MIIIIFVNSRIQNRHVPIHLLCKFRCSHQFLLQVGTTPTQLNLVSRFLKRSDTPICPLSTHAMQSAPAARHTANSMAPKPTSWRLISLDVSIWLTHTSKVSLHSLLSRRLVLEGAAFLDQGRGVRMSGRLSLRKLMERWTIRKTNRHGGSRTGWITWAASCPWQNINQTSARKRGRCQRPFGKEGIVLSLHAKENWARGHFPAHAGSTHDLDKHKNMHRGSSQTSDGSTFFP